MSVSVIIPAAGDSTRFPGMRPKWLLTPPSGGMMVTDAIAKIRGDVGSVHLIVRQDHIETYKCLDGIRKAFDEIGIDVDVVVLPDQTLSQPETVVRAIQSRGITGPIFVKDVDNQFEHTLVAENSVAVYDMNSMTLAHAANKSYVMSNDEGMLTNIVEKKVISSEFCVGGYSFEDSAQFVSQFGMLENNSSLYVSHLIFAMMLRGIQFKKRLVSDYVDWGTLDEWNKYRNQFVTLFIDIDGVLVKNSGEYFEPRWGTTPALEENVRVINKLYDAGKATVILTTCRKYEYEDATKEQLTKCGVKYHDIIFGLPHTRRIVINDYSRTNPYRSCDAINIERNSDKLGDFLIEQFGVL